MIYLTIEKRDVSIPTCWEDCTWGNVRGPKGNDVLEWVAHLTGLTPEKVRKQMAYQDYELIAQAIQFLNEPPVISLDGFSRQVVFNGIAWSIPEAQMIPTGPYQDIMHIIAERGEEVTFDDEAENVEKVCKLLLEAIMLETDYDYDRALERDISEMKYMDVMKMSAFFLRGARGWKSGTANNSPKSATLRQRLSRVIRSFRKSMALS
jgi:hypothetical protein